MYFWMNAYSVGTKGPWYYTDEGGSKEWLSTKQLAFYRGYTTATLLSFVATLGGCIWFKVQGKPLINERHK